MSVVGGNAGLKPLDAGSLASNCGPLNERSKLDHRKPVVAVDMLDQDAADFYGWADQLGKPNRL